MIAPEWWKRFTDGAGRWGAVLGVATPILGGAGWYWTSEYRPAMAYELTAQVQVLQQQILNNDINVSGSRLQQEQSLLFGNIAQQEQYKRQGQPVPQVFLDQQAQIMSNIEALRQRIEQDQARLRGQ
jgi:hypothetical protein